ncbi:hypothetical protein [Alicyclobacillus kakegawensis]|uniref:hypothetical protein n=1 Tax=Alicyclobacillus kakegawensis TaxID=392012 RepID=UPI00082DAAB5|nr:hypothetical protein [Alicyclobacillus kakegawensis]
MTRWLSRKVILGSLCLFYCAVVIGILVHGIHNREYNWDMVFYIGIAMSFSNPDPVATHHQLFTYLAHSIPPSQFHQLIGTRYTTAVYHSYELYEKIVPFYSVKPLYIWLIYILHRLSVPWIVAPLVINVASVAITAIVGLIWSLRRRDVSLSSYCVLAATALMASSSVFRVLTVMTPDALALCLITLFVVCVAAHKLIGAGVFSALAVLCRPDILIFVCGVLFLYGLYHSRTARWTVWLSTVIDVLLYGTVSRLQHGYSWGTLFVHAFYSSGEFDPTKNASLMTPSFYWRTVVQQVWAFITNTSVMDFLMVAILLLAAGLSWRTTGASRGVDHRVPLWILVVSSFSIIIHGLLFPNADDRFFVYEYVAIFLAGTEIVCHRSTPADSAHIKA